MSKKQLFVSMVGSMIAASFGIRAMHRETPEELVGRGVVAVMVEGREVVGLSMVMAEALPEDILSDDREVLVDQAVSLVAMQTGAPAPEWLPADWKELVVGQGNGEAP